MCLLMLLLETYHTAEAQTSKRLQSRYTLLLYSLGLHPLLCQKTSALALKLSNVRVAQSKQATTVPVLYLADRAPVAACVGSRVVG